MYTLVTPIQQPNPSDSKGNLSDELIDYLQGYTEYTSGKTFEFELAETKQRFLFKNSKNSTSSYILVSDSHYINKETGELEIVNDSYYMDVSLREFANIDFSKYRKAEQVDFDKYLYESKSLVDNSKVYKLALTIKQMNESDDDVDEDPYFRGNIEEYLKENNLDKLKME